MTTKKVLEFLYWYSNLKNLVSLTIHFLEFSLRNNHLTYLKNADILDLDFLFLISMGRNNSIVCYQNQIFSVDHYTVRFTEQFISRDFYSKTYERAIGRTSRRSIVKGSVICPTAAVKSCSWRHIVQLYWNLSPQIFNPFFHDQYRFSCTR